jgi:hypothetical protein
MHVAIKIPYVYDYITKSCRQQAEVTQKNENENVLDKAKPSTKKCKTLELGGSSSVYTSVVE